MTSLRQIRPRYRIYIFDLDDTIYDTVHNCAFADVEPILVYLQSQNNNSSDYAKDKSLKGNDTSTSIPEPVSIPCHKPLVEHKHQHLTRLVSSSNVRHVVQLNPDPVSYDPSSKDSSTTGVYIYLASYNCDALFFLDYLNLRQYFHRAYFGYDRSEKTAFVAEILKRHQDVPLDQICLFDDLQENIEAVKKRFGISTVLIDETRGVQLDQCIETLEQGAIDKTIIK